MSSFETNSKDMKDLLVDFQAGKIRLPDFRRGWVWEDSRKIGGAALSVYLVKLQAEKLEALNSAAMDALLHTHQLLAQFLRADDFDGFYAACKANLLALIEQAMGKAPVAHADAGNDDDDDGTTEETFAAAQAAEA